MKVTDSTVKRICFNCKSDKTAITKKGYKQWYGRNQKWYCRNCNNRLFIHQKYHSRRIVFKNKRIYLKEAPRKGVCDWCNKKIGDEYIDYFGKVCKIKRTHMHHIQYHEDDPSKDTVELCVSCHTFERWKLQKD